MPRCNLLGVVVVGVLLASNTSAQCLSFADSTPVDYLEYRDGRFTICYSADYPNDLEIAKTWMSRAFELGREKYGVLNPTRDGNRLELTVYLPPYETQATGQGTVRMACCYGRGGGNVTHAEIHYLTPSAWVGNALGGLQRPPEHYHPHYLLHETMHFFQLACCGLEAPSWIVEGMAESDGYRHTTNWNATEGVDRLTGRFASQELKNVVCCWDLEANFALGVSSVYWGGGWIMWYLADTYGEQIHVELLSDPLPVVLARYDTSLIQLYAEIRDYIQSWTPSVARSSFVPSLACTGRWWYSTSGQSFEIQILNNQERRSESDTLFQSQYRANSALPWTTKRSLARVRLSTDRSGYSTPLFDGLSSAPFQWRARTCPQYSQSDATCSDWSNIVNWTVTSCAVRQVGN